MKKIIIMFLLAILTYIVSAAPTTTATGTIGNTLVSKDQVKINGPEITEAIETSVREKNYAKDGKTMLESPVYKWPVKINPSTFQAKWLVSENGTNDMAEENEAKYGDKYMWKFKYIKQVKGKVSSINLIERLGTSQVFEKAYFSPDGTLNNVVELIPEKLPTGELYLNYNQVTANLDEFYVLIKIRVE